jgi:hypothetical protein
VFYLQTFPVRDSLWGRAAPVSHQVFREAVAATGQYSLLSFSDDSRYLTVLVAIGAAAAISVIVGFFTRESLVVSAVLLWSFHARNHYILDGGDNLGRILVLFLVAMSSSSWLSLDRRLGRASSRSVAGNILHNCALLAATLQLCALYLTSGTSKLMGSLWQSGTALYYVMRNAEFSRVAWAEQLTGNVYLVTLASYSVMALQSSFVLLVWGRRSRIVLIGALLLMHLGIAYFMGLVRFSMVTMASLVLLVPDSTLRQAARPFARLAEAARAGWRRVRGGRPPLAEPEAHA